MRHAWFSADPGLRLDEATYGWVDSALGLVKRISKPEFLAAIDTPILLGRPGREVVVSKKAQRRAARLLPNCALVELPESKHDPFLERDAIRDYWLACLDRFQNSRQETDASAMTQFGPVETQFADFAQHGAAISVAMGIPTGGKGNH